MNKETIKDNKEIYSILKFRGSLSLRDIKEIYQFKAPDNSFLSAFNYMRFLTQADNCIIYDKLIPLTNDMVLFEERLEEKQDEILLVYYSEQEVTL